ncbi:MAG: hypothetical protein V4543_07635 [Bacteroidota bacterium]
MNPLTAKTISKMETSRFISKNPLSKAPTVPKEENKSLFLELLPEGFAGEMLSLELRDGSLFGFPYALLSKIHLSRGNQLTLMFSEDKAVIAGIELKELYQYLIKHRVTVLREIDTRGFDLQNGKLSVSAITVEKREG